MSTVAKIFVVLNFVLAAVFLGSAAALLGHSDNWKTRHKLDTDKLTTTVGLRDEALKVKEAENAKLAGDKTQATIDRDAARAEAGKLQAAYDQTRKSYDELNASLANMSKALQVAQLTIQNGRALVDELQKERQTLVDNLTKANEEKNAAQKMQNQLELNLETLTQANQDTMAKLSTSELALQRVSFELEEIKRTNPGIGSGGGQPWQTGKILAADNEANIIVLSLGAEDGVKAGYRYTVSRGSNFVATIEISTVQAKQSAGRVLKMLSKSPVNVGDDVMTAR